MDYEKELIVNSVTLNKWVQRLMYTIQTEDVSPLPVGETLMLTGEIISSIEKVKNCVRIFDKLIGG